MTTPEDIESIYLHIESLQSRLRRSEGSPEAIEQEIEELKERARQLNEDRRK